MTRPPLLAVAQMTATADIEANLACCQRLVDDAKARGAVFLLLPECFAFLGEKDTDSAAMSESLEGPIMRRMGEMAKAAGLWLGLGGFQERIDEGQHYNTHVVVDDQGQVRASYRKIHLFDVDIPGGPCLLESRITRGGEALNVVDSPVGKLGLSVCYDLRFAEQYLAMTKAGAQVHLVPAAFTLQTGKEHWEVLLRARAIETQCYVAAAAQRGKHNSRRESFGHAMIVDPWGSVVAQCHDDVGIAVAPVDAGWLKSVRTRMPVWQHRRPQAYDTSV